MDDTAVDQITRIAGADSSRRRLLGALTGLGLGGVLTALGADDAGAEKPKDRLSRRTKQRRRKRRNEKRRNRNQNQNQNSNSNPGSKGGLGASNCTVCAQGCAFTSVQAAIDAASAGDTIAICAGRYTENLTISKNLTLSGPAPNNPAAVGGTGAAGSGSVVTVEDGVTATIMNMAFGLGTGTLEAGQLLGGGLLNFGNVTLRDSSIDECTAEHGGAIYSFGPLTLDNVAILHNTATGHGGGIFAGAQGELTATNTTRVESNTAVLGGGIYAEGDVTLTTKSVVAGNTATGDGGGIYNISQVTLDASIVEENTATGNGGGVYSQGTLIVQNGSDIHQNGARNGGGVYNFAEIGAGAQLLRLINSAVTSNTASEVGGGIYNDNGTVTLQVSTVTNNTATVIAGGLFNTDDGTVTLDTVSAIIENEPNDCIGTDACIP